MSTVFHQLRFPLWRTGDLGEEWTDADGRLEVRLLTWNESNRTMLQAQALWPPAYPIGLMSMTPLSRVLKNRKLFALRLISQQGKRQVGCAFRSGTRDIQYFNFSTNVSQTPVILPTHNGGEGVESDHWV